MLEKDTNCPNYKSCNRYRQNAPDDNGMNKSRGKNSQGKENASSLPFSFIVSPYSLWMVRNGFSIHFTPVVQQFTHCSRFRNSNVCILWHTTSDFKERALKNLILNYITVITYNATDNCFIPTTLLLPGHEVFWTERVCFSLCISSVVRCDSLLQFKELRLFLHKIFHIIILYSL